MKDFRLVTWFLKQVGADDAVIGDLIEQRQSGRSSRWLWRQALIAALRTARTQPLLIAGTAAVGWAVLWLFFGFLLVPLGQLDGYVIAKGLALPYSAAWWLRSILMWAFVGLPFVASGWIVGRVGPRHAMLPVLTFALSVSATVLIALVLDTRQGDPAPLRMWLTVPLLLIVAPATAIVFGGVAAARR